MRSNRRSRSRKRRRRRSMRGGGLWDTLQGLNPFAKKPNNYKLFALARSESLFMKVSGEY